MPSEADPGSDTFNLNVEQFPFIAKETLSMERYGEILRSLLGEYCPGIWDRSMRMLWLSVLVDLKGGMWIMQLMSLGLRFRFGMVIVLLEGYMRFRST